MIDELGEKSGVTSFVTSNTGASSFVFSRTGASSFVSSKAEEDNREKFNDVQVEFVNDSKL